MPRTPRLVFSHEENKTGPEANPKSRYTSALRGENPGQAAPELWWLRKPQMIFFKKHQLLHLINRSKDSPPHMSPMTSAQLSGSDERM